jgi:hypothetical protein
MVSEVPFMRNTSESPVRRAIITTMRKRPVDSPIHLPLLYRSITDDFPTDSLDAMESVYRYRMACSPSCLCGSRVFLLRWVHPLDSDMGGHRRCGEVTNGWRTLWQEEHWLHRGRVPGTQNPFLSPHTTYHYPFIRVHRHMAISTQVASPPLSRPPLVMFFYPIRVSESIHHWQ